MQRFWNSKGNMMERGPKIVKVVNATEQVLECYCGNWERIPSYQKLFISGCGKCGRKYKIDMHESTPLIMLLNYDMK